MIQSYGGGGFRIAGTVYTGSVVVFAEETVAWTVDDPARIGWPDLASHLEGTAAGSILLIGCGTEFAPPPVGFREAVREAGLALEWRDTGAACRTFNVLLIEERAAIAALIAVE